MKTFGLSITLLLLTCFQLSGQVGLTQLSGRVVDDKQAPVEFVNILLLNAVDSTLVKGTLTDSTGYYEFESVAPGRYLVSAELIGYTAARSEAFETRGETLTVPLLALSNGAIALKEVVVAAKRPFIEMQADKLVLNVESSPVAAGSNGLELLAKAPGVNVDQDNRISLKGKQGIQVMIDGKNTYMSMEDVVKMLQSTPANAIDKIEIMLNPSAKYDAAGNAGIINIKMKRDKNLGFNGSATIGGGYGRYYKANGGLRLNYRSKNFQLFGDYNNYNNQRWQNIEIDRKVPYEGGFTAFDQIGREINWVNSHNYKAGADWFVSPRTTVGVLYSGRQGDWDALSNTTSDISGLSPWAHSQVRADGDISEHWNNNSYNANFRHQFNDKGRELTFDVDYSTFDNDNSQFNFNYFYNANNQETAPPNLIRNLTNSDITIKAAKADYTHPLGESTRLEAGLKSSMVRTDNSLDFGQQQDGQWVRDSLRSDHFIYEEDIHAGYVNMNTQYKGIQIQAGLRAEYTVSDGMSVTLDQRVKRDYLSWFPSLSLSRQIAEKHNLSLSYSRRIDRPNYENLNPFVYFLDQYTFGKGNPFLTPQYTNSVSANYGFKEAFFVSVSYSRTNDVITEVLEQDDVTQRTNQTVENLAQFDNLSITFSAPFTLTKWWTLRANLTGFYNDFQSPFQGSTISQQQWSANAHISQQFSLPLGMSGELTAFYQSPSAYGMFQMQQQFFMDAGLSAKVLKGKGTLRFNVNDILNTMQFAVKVRQGNLDVDVLNYRESRKANLTFTYNFGNSNVKAARRRSTATEDEMNRINQN